jgi:hypothetical protein
VAITTGSSWLTNDDKLKQLAQITQIKELEKTIASDLKLWEQQPFKIRFSVIPDIGGFGGGVAQYSYKSIHDLEEKLSQFPSGTEFTFHTPPHDSGKLDMARTELRNFLDTHQFKFAGEVSDDY